MAHLTQKKFPSLTRQTDSASFLGVTVLISLRNRALSKSPLDITPQQKTQNQIRGGEESSGKPCGIEGQMTTKDRVPTVLATSVGSAKLGTFVCTSAFLFQEGGQGTLEAEGEEAEHYELKLAGVSWLTI
jgi:hypothetical protein